MSETPQTYTFRLEAPLGYHCLAGKEGLLWDYISNITKDVEGFKEKTRGGNS